MVRIPAVSAAFFVGVALLFVGELMPNYDASAVLSLLGGALLVVVAIRVLASWAGLHQRGEPALAQGETLLVESQGVTIEAPTLIVSSRRGPYRVRLTNERLLVSLRVMRIPIQRDLTAAWLTSGKPLSVRDIRINGTEIALTPERRFGPRLRMWAPNAQEWAEKLREHHPELLRYEGGAVSTST